MFSVGAPSSSTRDLRIPDWIRPRHATSSVREPQELHEE